MFGRKSRGRPKLWCSQECRRAAYEERRAADSGAIGTRIIEKKIELTLDERVGRVLTSPTACARVLDGLAALDADGPLSPYGQWSRIWKAAEAFTLAWRTRRS